MFILQDIYRDFITTLFIGVLHFTIIQIFTFRGAIVSEIQYSLPEAFCCFITRFTLYYRDFITTLIIGVLHFTIIQIFTFRGAIVSEIQYSLPEAICCFITRFTLFTEILSQR